MHVGEMQSMWSHIRPKEHARTRQKTSLTEVEEKLQKAGVYLVEGYVAVVDPGGLRPEWRGWKYTELGTAVRRVDTPPGDSTTKAVVRGSPTDVNSKRPGPGCVIEPTGENVREVDEDESVVSDDMSDMGEQCDLRAATMPDVSLSETVAVQQNTSQEGRRNSLKPYLSLIHI